MSRAIGDWEYKNPGLLAQMDKKNSVKKRKSTTTPKDALPEEKATGPYRNIEEAKKHQVSSFPDVKKVTIKPEHDFIILACDGIWDCFSNEQCVKFVRQRREKGPKTGSLSATKLSKSGVSKGLDIKKLNSESTKSPTKIGAKKDGLKKTKLKGETSFIVEEMMS